MSLPSDSQNPYAPPQSTGVPPVRAFPNPNPNQGPQFAPCPNCGCTFATKVGFTLWGGVLGPWLFTHVKCQQCQTAYNGKTGKSNTTAIVMYVVVSLLLVLAVVAAGLLGGW